MNRREVLKTSSKAVVGMVALPGLVELLQSCSVDEPAGYKPIYLNAQQYDTVWQMAELILPKTKTPGAADAGVAPFIDLLFASFFEADQKTALELGLNTFMEICQEQYGASFLSLKSAEQEQFMLKTEQSMEGRAFFKPFKQLVLWGFFTSEPGMKSMNYQPVPGKYDGCIEITIADKNLVGNR
jgi:hypothetical protein